MTSRCLKPNNNSGAESSAEKSPREPVTHSAALWITVLESSAMTALRYQITTTTAPSRGSPVSPSTTVPWNRASDGGAVSTAPATERLTTSAIVLSGTSIISIVSTARRNAVLLQWGSILPSLPPARHRQGVTGNVTGLVGCQEEDGVSDLQRLAEPLQRRHVVGAVLDRLVQLPEPGAEALGVDGARRHRVDGDLVLGELEGDVAHEAVHAGLGRGVRRAAGVIGGPRRALARAGGHADDPAAALAHHVRHRRARAQERRAEIQTQHEIPVLRLHLPDLGVAAAAHVVHENIDTPETLDARGDQQVGRRLLGEISRDGDGGATRRGDRGRGLVQPRGVEIAKRDTRAFARDQQRDLAAQTVGGSGDDGDSVTYARHRDSSSCALRGDTVNTVCTSSASLPMCHQPARSRAW